MADLSKLEIPELLDLIAQAKSRIAELQEAGKAELVARIEREALALGLDLNDLLHAVPPKRRGRKANARDHANGLE